LRHNEQAEKQSPGECALATFPRQPLNRNGCPNLKTRDGEKTPEEFSRLNMRKHAAASAKNYLRFTPHQYDKKPDVAPGLSSSTFLRL
jgi:hypothetical protein